MPEILRLVINSSQSLSEGFGRQREFFQRHKYITGTFRAGKPRSGKQNNGTHGWYEQIARELPEDDAAGWKRYCKLHHGVPILRAEDAQFKEFYDDALIDRTYEQKLAAMNYVPVTSLMTTAQLCRYAEAVQADFLRRGVVLEFGEE